MHQPPTPRPGAVDRPARDVGHRALAPSRAAGRISSSAIRQLLAVTERPGIISLAGGLPAAELFPVEAARVVLDGLLRSDPGVLQYSTTEGDPGLRRWIGARHGVGPEQVLVTHGAQQALDLVARAVVDDGDLVALADPGYVGAVQALRLSGGCLVGVPTDGDGMCVDVLEDELRRGRRPRLVYVVPNFHNPTGATLSTARARRLAALADRHGFLLVEDDPYGDIRFSGQAPPPLSTLTDQVVSIGSISKVLFPGLRVGWVVAPPALIGTLALVKQAVDLHTSTLSQRLAVGLLEAPGFLDDHVATLRAHYRSQAAVLAGALGRSFGSELHFDTPDGGMFLWGHLEGAGVDTEALLPAALDRGVAYVPGAAFSVGRPDRAGLRLSYATVAPAELIEGTRRLAAVLGR